MQHTLNTTKTLALIIINAKFILNFKISKDSCTYLSFEVLEKIIIKSTKILSKSTWLIDIIIDIIIDIGKIFVSHI